jgi:hypothetical protein
MTMDEAGNLFVADHENNAIRIISKDGKVSTYVGLDGIVPNVIMLGPVGLAQDIFGNLIIASDDLIIKIKMPLVTQSTLTSESLVVKSVMVSTIPRPILSSVSVTIQNTFTKTLPVLQATLSFLFDATKTTIMISSPTSTTVASQYLIIKSTITQSGSFTATTPMNQKVLLAQTSTVTKTFITANKGTPTPEYIPTILPIPTTVKYPNLFPENIIYFSRVPKKNQPTGIQIMGVAATEIYYLAILVSAFYLKWRTPFYRSTIMACIFLFINTLGYIFFLAYNVDRTIKISQNETSMVALMIIFLQA